MDVRERAADLPRHRPHLVYGQRADSALEPALEHAVERATAAVLQHELDADVATVLGDHVGDVRVGRQLQKPQHLQLAVAVLRQRARALGRVKRLDRDLRAAVNGARAQHHREGAGRDRPEHLIPALLDLARRIARGRL
eukprot:5261202-Prymnesium_polylepis.1